MELRARSGGLFGSPGLPTFRPIRAPTSVFSPSSVVVAGSGRQLCFRGVRVEEAFAAFGGNSGIPGSRLHSFPNLESRGGARSPPLPRRRSVALTLRRFPTAFPPVRDGTGGEGVGGGGQRGVLASVVRTRGK